MPFGAPGTGFSQSEQWDRKWAVTVGTSEFVQGGVPLSGLKITENDIAFKIEKSLKDEPNTCELRIYNLSEDHRAAIEELNPTTKTVSSLAKSKTKEAARKLATRGIPVKIEAGYGDDLSLLWLGDLRTAYSTREGPDWITHLESGDGEKAYQNARINVSFGPKTPVDTAVRALARAMGVGEGNLSQVTAKMRIAGKMFPQGTVVAGPVAPIMSDILRGSDLEWSIQNGALQIVDKGKALQETAIKVSANTGMLGSPTVDSDGVLSFEMQMIPGVRPGRLFVLDAKRIKGGYKSEKITWLADSAGDDWKIEVIAVRY